MNENSNTPSPSAAAGVGANIWEERYRIGDTPWEKGMPHPALVAWLKQNSLPGLGLVPGCGSGHDVRAFAAKGGEVIGFDLSSSAVERAQKYPPVGLERYRAGDLFAPPAEWREGFDWIFEHTCFCAIDPSLRVNYAKSMDFLLRPGGQFLAIFYLDPGNDGDGPPYGCLTEELEALFGEKLELLQEIANLPTYPGRENREILRLYQKPRTP